MGDSRLKSHQENLSELTELCREARANYQIWYALRVRNEGKFEKEAALFADFFQPVTSAAFNTFVICIWALVENKNSKSNLSIRSYLSSHPTLSESIKTQWKTLRDNRETLLDRVKEIRHAVVAHRNKQTADVYIFARHGFDYKEVEELIESIASFLRELGQELNAPSNIPDSRRHEYCALHLLRVISQTDPSLLRSLPGSFLVDPLAE